MRRNALVSCIRSSCFALCLAFAVQATAAPEPATRAERILATVDTVEGDLRPGGRYEKLGNDDKTAVRRQLAKIRNLLNGVTYEELCAERRMRLETAQEKVNDLLAATP